MFSDLIGNERVKRYLTRLIDTDRVGQSLLFAGPSGVGKGLFARQLAEAALKPSEIQTLKLSKGEHPDLHVYHPEGKIGMHTVRSMRNLIKEVHLVPNEAPIKVFLIEEAERMLPTSSNALLKTLEEPPSDTLILLVSSYPEELLPTIRSRCRAVRFEAVSEQALAHLLEDRLELKREQAEGIARRARGSVARALELAQGESEVLHERLLNLLMHGRVRDYGEVKAAALELAQELDKRREGWRQAQKESWQESVTELPASMREVIEKESEGWVSRQFAREVDHLLEDVLLWYRDLHLFRQTGAREILHHQHHAEAILDLTGQLKLPSMKKVTRSVEGTRLAIRRFTKLSTCFETLFLRLGVY